MSADWKLQKFTQKKKEQDNGHLNDEDRCTKKKSITWGPQIRLNKSFTLLNVCQENQPRENNQSQDTIK